MKNFFFLLLVIFTPLASYSVEPSEVLDDTVLEELARDISKDLRCLVCQNESIDESSATLAKDLRILVRERLLAGDNKDAVLKFIVDRYGEFVLLNPSSNGSNLILWLSGPLMLLIALIISFSFIKANQKLKRNTIIGLSDEEKRELEKIIREE
ncbi:MAG: cytochrome c-type biogenesis protein CcmH [Paracoccaceae bacterium]|jgi:cytochrome c-type biogenesis protein CcmH|nr:cytochrome c-type biogenesis protein CcmH [Paracoccaceae bacterium]